MRHSRNKPELTANVYTDPKLLDVAGAIEALPTLALPSYAAATSATPAQSEPQTRRRAIS